MIGISVHAAPTPERPEDDATATAREELDHGLEPILDGPGASDYERYLRTDELLSLQKTPEEWAHRDELLFQTVHQSSELWLKLAWTEVEEATRLLGEGEVDAAIRLLRRAYDEGLRQPDHIDPDFEPLRADSAYQELYRPRG